MSNILIPTVPAKNILADTKKTAPQWRSSFFLNTTRKIYIFCTRPTNLNSSLKITTW